MEGCDCCHNTKIIAIKITAIPAAKEAVSPRNIASPQTFFFFISIVRFCSRHCIVRSAPLIRRRTFPDSALFLSGFLSILRDADKDSEFEIPVSVCNTQVRFHVSPTSPISLHYCQISFPAESFTSFFQVVSIILTTLSGIGT